MKNNLISNIGYAVLITALFCVTPVFGQQKMTDREADGLKGRVKSVTTVRNIVESKNYYDNTLKVLKNLVESYNVNGTGTERLDYQYNSRDIYTVIDGDLTAKSSQIVKKPVNRTSIGGEIQQKPTQLEDKRYDIKYKFKFDEKGRRVETLKYGNTGIVYQKIEYKFDDRGSLVEELRYDDGATLNEQFLYTYEDAGNLTETKEILHRPDHNTISFIRYSNYKLDSTGNWIERTETSTQDYNEKELKVVIKYTRKIEYYK